ncbi:ferrochelatase [Roseococcus sp.]|uniref:ferrochelatase n=1 Tax=Roseococcus sp. TaxID=2109646 RepID=UPI003BAAEC3B
MTRRVAVVLFNLGGPDSPEAVRPFLVNLFTDPAILRVPGFVRPLLGRLIAWKRTKAAQENYAIIGGKSPLRELTEEQAAALEGVLNTAEPGDAYKCFVAMRYWKPFTEEAVAAVKQWGAEEILLIPLYPQFSSTTTGSSITEWNAECAKAGLSLPTSTLCCFHSDSGFAQATARMVEEAYDKARASLPADVPLRVLFSAHGLPEVIVKSGDPYQWQVEQTMAAVVAAMNVPGLDHVVCYQSRVTPQKWLGPSTDSEIERAAAEKVAVLISPIAFVSEHSETLVELDVEYRDHAEKLGIPGYFRVPAQNADAGFIAALADLVRRTQHSARTLCSFAGGRQCPRPHKDCPHGKANALQAKAA